MQGTRAVQVVLGEGEPGILRLILEAQGFHVVGHARGDDELRRVVALTRPSVIVLDAGISALAAADVQVRTEGTPIVVVWPKDVFTPVAEERVDPSTAFLELGNAVRRVIERHGEPVRIPDADGDLDPTERMEAPPSEQPSASRRWSPRRRHALVVAAAWTIALTALAAIGLAVPSALRVFEPAGTLHPYLDRPESALTADREGPGRGAPGVREEQSCGGRREHPTGPGAGHRTHGDRGCAPGRRGTGTPTGHDGGRGRPDDPGKGSGRDERNGHRGSNEGSSANDDPQSGGNDDVAGGGDQGRDGNGQGEDGHGDAGGSDQDGGGGESGGDGSERGND